MLYLYGNYNGDVFNFDEAADALDKEGCAIATVLGCDDVGSASPDRRQSRRGTAGLVFAYKCAGASAAAGAPLNEVARIARHVVDNVATLGVGLAPTILPMTRRASFELPDGLMEYGIGIHGEPGQQRVPIVTADELGEKLTEALADDLELKPNERVAVLVNGLGATPLEELYVVWRSVAQQLTARRIVVERVLVGEYVTSLEMAGVSLSILRVNDDLSRLLSAPARSVGYRT